MKSYNRSLFITLVGVFFSSSVLATDLQEGIYAPLSNGIYASFGSNICAGQSADFCSPFAKMKLSSEENKYISQDSIVFGQIKAKHDTDADKFKVSANFYVVRTCYVSTASKADDYGKKITIGCDKLKDRDAMQCDLFEPFDEVSVPIVFNYANAGEIKLEVVDVEKTKEIFGEYCFNELGNITFKYVSPKDYNHQNFVAAKLNFLRADSELNTLWKSLPKSVKDKDFLNEQRQWIKDKEKSCNPVTLKAEERELAKMYKCQTEMTETRITKLRQLAN